MRSSEGRIRGERVREREEGGREGGREGGDAQCSMS